MALEVRSAWGLSLRTLVEEPTRKSDREWLLTKRKNQQMGGRGVCAENAVLQAGCEGEERAEVMSAETLGDGRGLLLKDRA